MALTIRQYPNPILKQATKLVTTFDDHLYQFTNDMLETMYQNRGIGLAAPQVGDSRAVLVMDVPLDMLELSSSEFRPPRPINKSPSPSARVMINPKLLGGSNPQIGLESCLSLLGLDPLPIKRLAEIQISYQNTAGKTQQKKLTGVESICFQHELDHLHGKLIIDHQSLFKRQYLKRRMLAQQVAVV